MLEQEYIDLNDDYSGNITNYYPSNAVGLSQNSNHQSTDRSKSLNFGKSWIANHISKDSIYKKKNRWGTKKLTHFIDTMLTYDFKHGLKTASHNFNVPRTEGMKNLGSSNQKSEPSDNSSRETKESLPSMKKTEKETTLHAVDTISWKPKNNTDHKYMKENMPNELNLIDSAEVQTEREAKNTEQRLEEWKHGLASEYDQSSSSEDSRIYEPVTNNENHLASMTVDGAENAYPLQESSMDPENIVQHKTVTSPILDENIPLNTLEPDSEEETEELHLHNETNSESDEIVINDDSYLPIEDEEQIANDAEEVQIQDEKLLNLKNGAKNTEMPSNEYDEINFLKSTENALISPLRNVRSLSTIEGNHPRTSNIRTKSQKIYHFEKEPRIIRKSNRKSQKQQTIKTNMNETFKPLVNQYAFSPFGGAPMMSQPGPFYAFPPPALPFNYWMAKPPISQFNMFPYSYPWQNVPFQSHYYQPVLSQNVASNPYLGPPSIYQPNMNPNLSGSPYTTTAQGVTNSPADFDPGQRTTNSGSFPVKRGETNKTNINYMKKENKTTHSQFSKPETGNTFYDHYGQSYLQSSSRHRENKVLGQPFKNDQRITEPEPYNRMQNPNYEKQPSQYSQPYVRSSHLPDAHNSRLNPPSPTYGNAPLISSHGDYSTARNWTKSHVPPPSYPVPNGNQRGNSQNHQYDFLINEQERARSRPNYEFPSYPGARPSTNPGPGQSWYHEVPHYPQESNSISNFYGNINPQFNSQWPEK
ncbi:uncharacterized protein LOC128982775 isoform X2 [Macrosteles quadrilineatus]|uniref:uncharacterized protein LOC128982775 isoform X2 n=1 Tax=Macrosteles quadrilineatus TaxID=74068 RepID=UPI0023E0E426|nr:uncharacterized protein LOC128982775 isoform X2 [Macrosteles quadrilineatus]